jgi:cobaltochelatase CobS
LEQLTPQAPQLDEAAIEAVIDRKVKDALAGVPSITIKLQREPGKVAEPLLGLHHKLFPDLLQVIAARTAAGKPLNIWIAGPAASGKTSAAMKVAEALDRRFYGNGAVTFAEQLFGFIDAHGVYHTTAFRNAYEHGGVYVFDDTDGSDANATTAFNMGLENGVCPFPDRMVERHPDCVIIATANTWGSGATADYVGRNKLDGAFLDRFGVKLPWDYDVALESAVSGNPEWAQRVIAARARARAAGLKVLITPRASIAGAALIAQGMSADKAASYTYLANLTAEQRRMVEGE